MKSHYLLFIFLSFNIISHAMHTELNKLMNTKVQLPSPTTLETYLQDYKELSWFIRKDLRISAEIPENFGNHKKSPQELKTYLWDIDTQLSLHCGIMQPTESYDQEILKVIHEIINIVFQDHQELLKQIKAELEKRKKF